MTSPFSTRFVSRDFASHLILGASVTPQTLSWSAFGGPDRAMLRMDGSLSQLLKLAGLLRSPVFVDDLKATPVWWGYVDQITIYFEGSKFTILLDQLFNKVKVTYSFISPDNRLADQLETAYASSAASQLEYGIREAVIHRLNLDEDFAEEFRDTFLELHQWPTSVLSSLETPGQVYAEVSCSGWFSTLAWQSYENLDGFYANYGPGPGSFNFGVSGQRIPSQKFTPSVACDLKYVYFLLRKNNSPTNDLTARLYSDSGGAPNAVLASSSAVGGATLPSTGYSWIRFDFTPYTLSAATSYWVGVIAAPHATNNFFIRIDENACYYQTGHYAKYYNAGTWYVIPNVTSPATYPDLHFRVICINDTGSQLLSIADAGDQFFADILSFNTNLDTSPFRSGQNTCLEEITTLMELGTSNHRLILATVTPNLILKFYEQPDITPTSFIDAKGKFYSSVGSPVLYYFPPIGQWVGLVSTDRHVMPFDQHRVPTCFVQHAEYDCISKIVRINKNYS